MNTSPADACICGHPRTAHEHYRRGTDCALCPAGRCTRFRTSRSLVDAFRRLRRRRG